MNHIGPIEAAQIARVKEAKQALYDVEFIEDPRDQRIASLEWENERLRKKLYEYEGSPFGAGAKIIRAVAKAYGVSIDDLKSERRNRHIVEPRQYAMWLMRQRTRLSLPQIGRLFGGRDHTTALHACRKMDQKIACGWTFPDIPEEQQG